MSGMYRVLRPGVSQRRSPGGPIVECAVGDVIEVSDSMAEFFMADPDPFVEPETRRRRKPKEEKD